MEMSTAIPINNVPIFFHMKSSYYWLPQEEEQQPINLKGTIPLFYWCLCVIDRNPANNGNYSLLQRAGVYNTRR